MEFFYTELEINSDFSFGQDTRMQNSGQFWGQSDQQMELTQEETMEKEVKQWLGPLKYSSMDLDTPQKHPCLNLSMSLSSHWKKLCHDLCWRRCFPAILKEQNFLDLSQLIHMHTLTQNIC